MKPDIMFQGFLKDVGTTKRYRACAAFTQNVLFYLIDLDSGVGRENSGAPLTEWLESCTTKIRKTDEDHSVPHGPMESNYLFNVASSIKSRGESLKLNLVPNQQPDAAAPTPSPGDPHVLNVGIMAETGEVPRCSRMFDHPILDLDPTVYVCSISRRSSLSQTSPEICHKHRQKFVTSVRPKKKKQKNGELHNLMEAAVDKPDLACEGDNWPQSPVRQDPDLLIPALVRPS
ncbi:hypothetical protein RRG08_053268 [Elysia crispata]|uniref:Uncharacterized protein n=1 Tax=Elysia crispata TaxID=231223 RepID=A0AAE1ANP6_9GAST|nr:hypothetical protein RRG08_053268 [Elysia crispata]